MIPLPTPPVRGQPIQADLLRDVIDALRRARPIQGQGILLQETMQGTIIAAAAQVVQSGSAPFDHRFKVTPRADGDGFALHVRKGSLFEVTGGISAEKTLTLEGLEQAPDDADAWRVANATAGSLCIRKNKPAENGSGSSGDGNDAGSEDAEDGNTGSATPEQGYTLAYGDPEGALFVIADFTPNESSSNPSPKVTQRVLGDLYAFPEGAGGGLTVGPPELLSEGEETMLAWYAGTVAWDAAQQRYAFTRATTPEGDAAQPLFTLPLVAHRKDHAPGIPYTEQ